MILGFLCAVLGCFTATTVLAAEAPLNAEQIATFRGAYRTITRGGEGAAALSEINRLVHELPASRASVSAKTVYGESFEELKPLADLMGTADPRDVLLSAVGLAWFHVADKKTENWNYDWNPDLWYFVRNRAATLLKKNTSFSAEEVWERLNDDVKARVQGSESLMLARSPVEFLADEDSMKGALMGLSDEEQGMNLTGVTIGPVSITGGRWANIAFSSSRWELTKLERVKLANATFTNAQLDGCLFRDVVFENASFTNTALAKTSVNGGAWKNGSFAQASLVQADFRNVDFANVSFANSTMEKVTFVASEFTNVAFASSRLSEVTFVRCTFENCAFAGVAGNPEMEDCTATNTVLPSTLKETP